MSIYKTDAVFIYKAAFDFGIIKGLMYVGPMEYQLEKTLEWCEEDEPPVATRGDGRRRPDIRGTWEKLFPRMVFRDVSMGEIHRVMQKGAIEFKNDHFSFTGIADMAGIGRGVSFTAVHVTPNRKCIRCQSLCDIYVHGDYLLRVDVAWRLSCRVCKCCSRIYVLDSFCSCPMRHIHD
ncbi:hypothetical protein B0H67DRAFT_25117 [Lasiosphaeris hirsuta]|uniref:Uncharacterized protein n=1 Tax=Lasiosphaeris hirsuta TaxID=260670 RepID=A0AA40B9M6_9PEZI|nr:hypothetical protein B0H67DRAFT_25117 [Lasiosphaeris hirsuta]